jgi:MFS family permease
MGIGLGASQPIVLSLLHNVSPPGRIGEVNGMRMTMISTSQWTMPLVFGSLSATTGLLPLFLVIFGGIIVGVLIGFVWEWFREHGHRANANQKGREVARLERELAVLKDSTSVPPKDEVLALLDAPRAR